MAGLVPAIHAPFSLWGKDVDARHKAGHDELEAKAAGGSDDGPPGLRHYHA